MKTTAKLNTLQTCQFRSSSSACSVGPWHQVFPICNGEWHTGPTGGQLSQRCCSRSRSVFWPGRALLSSKARCFGSNLPWPLCCWVSLRKYQLLNSRRSGLRGELRMQLLFSLCFYSIDAFFHWKMFKKTREDTIERAAWDSRQTTFRGPATNAPVPSEETSQLVVSEVILFVFSPCLCLPLGTLCKTLLLLLKGLSDSRAQQPGCRPAGEASDPVEPGRASRLTALLGWLGEPASPLSKVFDWSSTFLRNILGFSKSALRVGASSCWKLSERASGKLWHRGCSRSGRPAFNSNTAVGLVSGQHTERGKFPGEKLLLV